MVKEYSNYFFIIVLFRNTAPATNKRLSEISADEDIFNAAAPHTKKHLEKAILITN